jgi:serine/threonine-protein kinase
VVGQSQADALSSLRALGLTGAIVAGNVNAPQGTIAEQSPAPGTAVQPGARITLTVATGFLPVPEVSGKSEGDALGILHGADFHVPSIRRQANPGTPAGISIGTQPPAGRLVQRGSDVDLIISSGPGG